MPAVPLRLVGARVRERVRERHLREGRSRGGLIFIDTDSDVLVERDASWLASRSARTLRHAFAAPRDLLGTAPVEGCAVGPFAREMQHLRPERPEVDPDAR